MITVSGLTAEERGVLLQHHKAEAKRKADAGDYRGAFETSERAEIFREEDLKVIPLSSLTLTVRTLNCLSADGITTVAQVIERTPQQVMRCPNLGRKSLAELQGVLHSHGWYLKGEI